MKKFEELLISCINSEITGTTNEKINNNHMGY